MAVSGVRSEHQASHQLFGHDVGFVLATAEFRQVLSADPFNLVVGEARVQDQVGGEFQRGGPVLG